MRRESKQEQGITLIALVVTLIILIILVAVSINMVLGEQGLFKKAQEGANSIHDAELNTQVGFNDLAIEIEEMIEGKPILNTGDIQFKIDENYTNRNVLLEIVAVNKKGYIIKYKQKQENEWKKYEGPIEIDKNTTIEVRYEKETNENIYSESVEKKINNIDKLLPNKPELTTTKTDNSFSIVVNCQDQEATEEYTNSGIKQYRFSKDGGMNWSEWQQQESYTFSSLQGGVYQAKVQVEDNAGNIVESDVSKVGLKIFLVQAGGLKNMTNFIVSNRSHTGGVERITSKSGYIELYFYNSDIMVGKGLSYSYTSTIDVEGYTKLGIKYRTHGYSEVNARSGGVEIACGGIKIYTNSYYNTGTSHDTGVVSKTYDLLQKNGNITFSSYLNSCRTQMYVELYDLWLE